MPNPLDLHENQSPFGGKEQPADESAVLQARPVEGEIDYTKLIRDTMAKFPRILAALAK